MCCQQHRTCHLNELMILEDYILAATMQPISMQSDKGSLNELQQPKLIQMPLHTPFIPMSSEFGTIYQVRLYAAKPRVFQDQTVQTKSSIVTNDFARNTIICIVCNLRFDTLSNGNFSVSPRSLLLVIQCYMLYGKFSKNSWLCLWQMNSCKQQSMAWLLDDYSELRSMENTLWVR